MRLFLFALLAVLGAFLLRLPTLRERPFHTDEAVNAFILQETFEGGFQYRANDHHGPTLYLIAAAALGPSGITRVAQMEAWMLRLIPAVCGALLAGSVYLFFPYMGAAAVMASAVLLAVLAPFHYYSGIFIHEILLLLFLSCYLATLWRGLVCDRRPLAWMAVAGCFAGLMLATKETAALLLLAVTGSALLALCFGEGGGQAARSLRPGARNGRATTPDGSGAWNAVARGTAGFRRGRAGQIAIGLLVIGTVAFLTVLAVFSSFGRYPDRAWGLFGAIGAQVGRGLGGEHAYPWWTYAKWFSAPGAAGIPWSGWLLPPLALWAALTGWRDAFTRALTFSAVFLFLVFSALPYKTPWLMLAWEFPLALLAGNAIARLWDGPAFLAGVASLVGLALLGHETLNRCHRFATDPANSLAYSPSSPDLQRLERDLAALAARAPEHHDIVVQVIARDYWPLPWTLRHFPRTGFWTEPPERIYDGLVLCGPEYVDQVHLGAAKFESYSLRPGVFIFLAKSHPTSDAL